MVVSQITSPMITSRSIPKIVLCHRSDCIAEDAGKSYRSKNPQGSGGAVCRQWPCYNGDARVSCDLRIWNVDGSEIRAITKTSCEVDSWSTIIYGFVRHTRWWSPDFFHQKYFMRPSMADHESDFGLKKGTAARPGILCRPQLSWRFQRDFARIFRWWWWGKEV